MSTKKYNKLVRDKIPDIIASRGHNPIVQVLEEKQYIEQLVEKLYEEVEEFDEDRSVDEMADIIEVLMALAKALDISQTELTSVRNKKAIERGTFKKRLFLKKVED